MVISPVANNNLIAINNRRGFDFVFRVSFKWLDFQYFSVFLSDLNIYSSHKMPVQRSRDSNYDKEQDEKAFYYNNLNANYNFVKQLGSRSPSLSPARDFHSAKNKIENFDDFDYDYRPNPDEMLKMKWMDYTPRMSRLREQRTKRLLNRLEVWLGK
jgi:hypothetical protein